MADDARIPSGKSVFSWALLVGVILVCLIPSLLNLSGWDFGVSAAQKHAELHGLLLHTILVWTATCAAFFVFLLSFFHYAMNRDIVMPVMGISLLWGGFVDLFQTLAADRFIQASADASALIPLTWAIGRAFGNLILLIGVMILMVRRYQGRESGNMRFFVLLAVAFGLVAVALGDFLSREQNLPTAVFPDLLISRPWDVLPLFLYAIAGLWVLRKFHAHRRDHFSFSIWISVIPDFVAQLHMAFGSSQLFDNHYVLAQVFKVVSYAVPAAGLMKDYVEMHRKLERAGEEKAQIEKQRQALARLVEGGSEMTAVVSADGSLYYMNGALRAQLGMESWVAAHPPALADVLYADQPYAEQTRWLEKARQCGYIREEAELRTVDGARLIPSELSLFVLDEGDAHSDFGLVVRDVTEERKKQEDRERHERELRELINKRTTELAETNQRLLRELNERKALEARLVKSQKLEAMGQLSAGIAHEINNPVNYVRMNLETFDRYLSDVSAVLDAYSKLDGRAATQDPLLLQAIHLKQKSRLDFVLRDARELLRESKEGLTKVTEIVRSLRALSHPEVGERKPIQVNDVLESALRMVHNEVKRHQVVREMEELPMVWGSAVQLSQVFVNLIHNAAQAMEQPGTLTIRSKRHENQVVVQIKDTGVGIPEELGNKIFEPFFTTKPVGQGSGLGLYISYGIVREHGGDLTYWSRPGAGTTFRVALPIDPRAIMSGNRENR